jgi:hypothetical protein
MSPKKTPQRKKPESAPEVTSYRGRKIEVFRAAPAAAGARGAAVRMRIDGKEISIERTELGYMSHENMFMVYSSPYELAEDLIRQWGDAAVQPSTHHDHPPDHGKRGGRHHDTDDH